MKKLLQWAIGLIPPEYRILAAIAVALAVTAAIGAVVYFIEQRGYNRCEAAHATAVIEQKDESRGEIIESGKEYEKIKTEIVHVVGPNDLAGPRTSLALDRLP